MIIILLFIGSNKGFIPIIVYIFLVLSYYFYQFFSISSVSYLFFDYVYHLIELLLLKVHISFNFLNADY